MLAEGALAKLSAINSMKAVKTDAIKDNPEATIGNTGDTKQAIKPITVTGATSGSAITLAAIEYTGIVGCSMRRTGRQAIWAARETETTTASQNGILLASTSTRFGANTKSPRVASAESANPKSIESDG